MSGAVAVPSALVPPTMTDFSVTSSVPAPKSRFPSRRTSPATGMVSVVVKSSRCASFRPAALSCATAHAAVSWYGGSPLMRPHRKSPFARLFNENPTIVRRSSLMRRPANSGSFGTGPEDRRLCPDVRVDRVERRHDAVACGSGQHLAKPGCGSCRRLGGERRGEQRDHRERRKHTRQTAAAVWAATIRDHLSSRA